MNNTITIQNKAFKLFEQKCFLNGCTECIPHDRYVDIQVFLTNECNAHCAFCCNPQKQDNEPFDIIGFSNFIDEVYSKIKINKITFTGGECGLWPLFTKNLIERVHDKCDCVVVNTNGTLDFGPLLQKYPKLNIALSRHHYWPERNNQIFGTTIKDPFCLIEENRRVNVACNLIKGEIDSVDKMCAIMDWAANHNIHSVSFVGLMPVNQYCIDNHVDPFSLDLNRSDILKFRSLEFPVQNKCRCTNYIYVTDDGEFVYFYLRKNLDHCYNKGGLLIWKNNKLGDSYGL